MKDIIKKIKYIRLKEYEKVIIDILSNLTEVNHINFPNIIDFKCEDKLYFQYYINDKKLHCFRLKFFTTLYCKNLITSNDILNMSDFVTNNAKNYIKYEINGIT